MSEKGNIVFNKYRHLIFAIAIVIIIIILDIIFENYSKSIIKKVNVNIDKIYKEFEENNYNENKLEKLAKNSKNEWEKKEKFLSCFIEHDEFEKINIKLNILYIKIKNKNWVDAKADVIEIKKLVEYLKGKYELSIQNLF